MGLAIFFLFRSMTKQLRKVRVSADDGAAASSAEAGRPGGPGAPGRVSTGAAATDAAANKEGDSQGS
jgi:hypothetical protein